MGLRKADIAFFNDMVGQAAIGLGVSTDDATAVGKALNGLFNIECAPPAQLTPQQDPMSQGFCLDKGCDVGDKNLCAENTVAPAVDGRPNKEVPQPKSKVPDMAVPSAGGGGGEPTSGSGGADPSKPSQRTGGAPPPPPPSGGGDPRGGAGGSIFGGGSGIQRIVKCIPRVGAPGFRGSEL